jgi:hypothetical protein
MLSRTSIVCKLPLKTPKRNSASQLRAKTTTKLTQKVLAVYPSELDTSGTLKYPVLEDTCRVSGESEDKGVRERTCKPTYMKLTGRNNIVALVSNSATRVRRSTD